MIDFYLEHYQGEYPKGAKGLLLRHAGQHYAFAGDYEKALPYFENIGEGEHPVDEYYTSATIAFLQRDKNKLVDIVSQIPDSNEYRSDAQYLLERFDQPY